MGRMSLLMQGLDGKYSLIMCLLSLRMYDTEQPKFCMAIELDESQASTLSTMLETVCKIVFV